MQGKAQPLGREGQGTPAGTSGIHPSASLVGRFSQDTEEYGDAEGQGFPGRNKRGQELSLDHVLLWGGDTWSNWMSSNMPPAWEPHTFSLWPAILLTLTSELKETIQLTLSEAQRVQDSCVRLQAGQWRLVNLAAAALVTVLYGPGPHKTMDLSLLQTPRTTGGKAGSTSPCSSRALPWVSISVCSL
jgi:hypothetical protein